MKKLLFCLGVSKAGTTWLHNALTRHPGVVRIPRKEIHYFLRQYGPVDRLTDQARLHAFGNHVFRARFNPPDRTLGNSMLIDPDSYGAPWDGQMAADWAEDGVSLNRYRSFLVQVEWYKRFLKGPVGHDWYRSLFAHVPDDRWALDFSTTNCLATEAGYADMAGFAEETRALLILRDPIDRLWSHMKFHGEMTRDIPRFHVWSLQALRDFASHHQLVDSSLYADKLDRLSRHFGARAQVLNFEDIGRRPEAMWQDLLGFLGLPEVPLPQNDREAQAINVSKEVEMRPGQFAHLCGDFERDLTRVAEAGHSFVEPWIARVQAHAREKPEREYWGMRPLARRAANYLAEDRERRRALKEARR